MGADAPTSINRDQAVQGSITHGASSVLLARLVIKFAGNASRFVRPSVGPNQRITPSFAELSAKQVG